MSNEYSYEVPDKNKFLLAIIAIFRSKNENDIADLLKGCSCDINPSSQYSYVRWNCFSTSIHFSVPISKLGLFPVPVRKKITEACKNAMPLSAGYDVMEIEISPLLEDLSADPSLSEDLDQISAELSQQIIPILPEDIKTKGKEMAEVYLYLYCVENSLRLFIEDVAKKQYGDDYFTKLSIPKPIQKGIDIRKTEEASQKWLRIRGDSDLFYLDFGELGAVIQNNWELFKDHFPNQQWILSKIEEIVKCRNLVAHNSYIGSHEKEVIRVYYRSILKQIGILQ